MNNNVHPAVIVVAIAVLLAGIGMWGYKASQPAPYQPSPGVVGASGLMPGRTVAADGGYGVAPPEGTKPGSKIDVPGNPTPATN
jgi:hypothetical protein